jgi:hypothetical protein
MIRPEDLKKPEPLLWSTGSGTDVWEMFCACRGGDRPAVKRLVDKDPSLVRSHHAYRTPISFAVRENRIEVVAFLLERGASPLGLAVNDSLLEICRDRGHGELERLLGAHLADTRNASPRGGAVAAAIREHDLPGVRRLLDASPELLHAGDPGSNQPIHWAAMTRQTEVIDELLARGANIDAVRSDGARPIQLTNGDYCFRGWRDVPRDCWSAGRTRTSAKKASHRTATPCTRPSRTGISGSPGCSWNTAPSRTRRSRAPRTPSAVPRQTPTSR